MADAVAAGYEDHPHRPQQRRTPPPPPLDPAVIAAATERYTEIFRRLTGTPLDVYEPPSFGTAEGDGAR